MENNLQPLQRKEFDIFDTALACVLFIVFNVVFMFLFNCLPVNIRSNEIVYYTASFLVEFLFAVTAWTVAKSRKVDILPAVKINKKVNGKIVGWSFLIALVCLVFFAPMTEVFLDFLSLCGYSSVIADIEINNFWTYLLYVVISCITPAVCEEILFRGTILSGFKAYGEKVAIVLSALIFMLMHGSPDQTVHQFILGLVVGFMFIKSGNIWLGVLVHFFNNFISVTQVYLVTLVLNNVEVSEEVVAETTSVTFNPWLSLLVEVLMAIIFFMVGFYLIKKLFNKILEENAKVNAPKVEAAKATITADGEQVETEMLISGDAENSEKDFQGTPENLTAKDTKPSPLPMSVIIMFVASGLYLVGEWIYMLIVGFGL